MQYELARNWKYTGGAEGDPGGKTLEAGTVLGSIDIKDGIPMSPQQLSDAVHRKLAVEVKGDSRPTVGKKAKRAKAVVEDA